MTNNPTLIYLAGPIDEVVESTAKKWREEMGDVAGLGTVFFSPAHAYIGVTPENFRAVDYMNRQAIQACNGMIARLLPETLGFGTIREIEFARLCGKPVVVVAPEKPVSLMMHDVSWASTLEEGLQGLLEQVAGERERPQGGIFLHLPGQGEPE